MNRSGRLLPTATHRDLAAALPGWLAARVIVLGALALGRFIGAHFGYGPRSGHLRLHQGLLAWDGDWYLRIARHGYAGVPRIGVRFFPLLPLLGRTVGAVSGGPAVGLILVANAAALAGAAVLHRLVRHETGDAALAGRAAWLVAVVPTGFVLAFAYTESLSLLIGAAAFLALRTRRWGWAAVFGVLAGLTRPTGVLLAVPALLEVLPGLRRCRARQVVARAAAVVGAPLGCALYLAWVGLRFGHPLLPFTVQQDPRLRGRLAEPVSATVRVAWRVAHGTAGRNTPHLWWAVALVALVVVALRTLPRSYGAFAGVTLLVALSTDRLGSLERYGFGAFPVVVALAWLLRDRRLERAVGSVSAAMLGVLALLSFLAVYVP